MSFRNVKDALIQSARADSERFFVEKGVVKDCTPYEILPNLDGNNISYTRAKKLTPRMLNELIEKIEVHQAEKVNGVWEQRLTIHYNCIGAIDIPDEFPLHSPEVSVNTRKGVVVNYAPNTLAG